MLIGGKKGKVLDVQCQECQKAFEKDGIPFKASMCKFCSHGRKLHEKEVKESKAEKAWDKCDWGSSKYKDFYHGGHLEGVFTPSKTESVREV